MPAQRPTTQTDKATRSRILLIDDDPKEIRLIREWLGTPPRESRFSVEAAGSLSTGLKRLSVERYELVLLNLSLPDSKGIETLHKVRKQAPDVPVIVQGRMTDESVAVDTLKQGAQDYLLKADMNPSLLARSIRYAIERQRLLEEIRNLALIDELTGLSNRRGFTTLAEKQLQVAKRANERMHGIFLDVDELKEVNDRWGHAEGDRVLQAVAQVLRASFRESDILARVGGDEFCVLARDCGSKKPEILTRRLLATIEERNRREPTPYRISVSLGIVNTDPAESRTPAEILQEADKRMYSRKRIKKNRKHALGRVPPRAARNRQPTT